jgi:hypothetical protein
MKDRIKNLLSKLRLTPILITACVVSSIILESWPIVVALLGLLVADSVNSFINTRYKQPLEKSVIAKLQELDAIVKTLRLKNQGIDGLGAKRSVRF